MTVEYFLDYMQDYEISYYVDYIPYLDRASWEQNRFSIYSNIQMNTKKKLEPTDIIKFAWEKEEETTNTITNDDKERLKEKSKLISKLI